jgi:hypothetical protein
MMILGAEERSRLTAAARAIPSEGSEQDGFTKGTDVLSAEPRAVFAQSLQALRARAVIAEQLSDEELVEFQQQLGLLLAGLRGTCAKDKCRGRCEEELKRCQEPDPESGRPHLDCFMVFADCLVRCSSETGSTDEGCEEDQDENDLGAQPDNYR